MDARFAILAALASASILSTVAAPLADPSLSAGQNIKQETGEVTVNGGPVTVVRYTWRDSASRPRSVSLVPASASTTGYAAQMTYQVNDGVLRTVFVDAAPPVNGDEGFGYFVSHELYRNDGNVDFIIGPLHGDDDSPYGRNLNTSTGSANTAGSTQATHEYRLTYKRWGTVATIADPSVTQVSQSLAAHQFYDLPVVIRWHFVSGQDYPLWSLDYDLSAATNHIATDVRAPYGVMRFNEGSGPDVTALRWGDWYHFAADANGADFGTVAQPAAGINWVWTAPNNGRRYHVLGSGQYEFGIVDTRFARTAARNYADGYSDHRGTTRVARGGCPGEFLASMPCPYEWAYQSFQYDAGPPARPKLAWGTSPFLGSTLNGGGAYNGLENEPLSGTGHISYGVHIVTGKAGTGTPLTLARAAAAPEPDRTLTLATSGNGGIAYTVLGDTGGPYTTTRAVAPWSSVRLVATANAGSTFSGWTGACAGVASNTCMITMQGDNTVGASFAGAAGSLTFAPTSVGMGFQFVDTPSPLFPVTVTNGTAGSVSVSQVATSAPFGYNTTCGTLAAGASCTINVSVLPSGAGVPLNGTTSLNGTLTVTSNAPGSPHTVTLSATGEKTLVRHYYQAILGRTPDVQGQQFWQGEAARMVNLGVSVNETWFVMAGYFFNSAEYLAANKNGSAYVTDLYRTFFNRAPDAGGLQFWVDQMVLGLPREVVLFNFMFSAEFASFTQGIFGNAPVRPEVTMVVDFFRGILNRLPDSSSLQYWVGQLRSAQCQGAGPVYNAVDSISAAFIFNPEYNNRQRNNTQYVTDMYYAFLRRGGDRNGVSYWINQLDTGQMNANTVRFNFFNNPEFGNRVQAVVNAGCYAGP